jgi:SAM-dependent methyltransferase
MTSASNAEQHDYWNRTAGARWATHQDALDQMVRPFGEAALARLALQAGEHVLDIGCGCGETLIQIARLVGQHGSVTGADLSAPMLARARERAPSATLIEGDASILPFARKFDAMYSRFGVMFFSDPVGAFRHLAQALVPAGRIAFVCWRLPAENPWVTLPIAAVRSALPHLCPPAQDPSAGPGPFSLSKQQRIEEVLSAAGLASIHVEPFEADVTLSDTGLTAAVDFALTVTPVARFVAEATPEERRRAEDAVARALEPYLRSDQLRLRAAAWTVLAEAG